MSAVAHLPGAKEVRDLLTDMLDKDVDLRPGPPFAVSEYHPATVASYVDDSLVVRAVIALDLPLSAYTGAALALVPRAAAEAAVQERALTPALSETLHEVLNIAASLFNAPGAPHVRLYAVHAAGEMAPPDVRARTQVLGRRLDLQVEVGGYGKGRLAVVLS